MRSVRASCLAAALALIGSLAARTAPAFAEGPCDPAKAETLVGKTAPSDAEVGALTGARTVRRIAPAAPVTLDHRPNRITLEIDKGKVLRARCG